MVKGIVEILYFVPDRRAAAEWYAQFFGVEISLLDYPDAYFFRIGGQDIWFHLADEKVPAGAAGQVAYWQVDDFGAALAKAQTLGAELYRGPLKRLDGQFMCQVKDPFGNLLGLVGSEIKSSEDIVSR
jgi:predicted enzyme related to lactoylglutathione lyase